MENQIIYISVSEGQKFLTVEGNIELLDRLLAVIRGGHEDIKAIVEKGQPIPGSVSIPLEKTAPSIFIDNLLGEK